MKEWADYLISEVLYDQDHLILLAKRYEELESGIKNIGLVDRIQISSDIANGLSYLTIYNRMSTWKKGKKIQFFRIRGQPFLRVDENKVNQDYLGDIPEIKTPLTHESGATPEQIALLEQLEKQKAELKLKSSKEEPKPTKILRGSLPKENAAELPQELDLVPEPIIEPEEATPEQIARLEQLEKQIAELESQPSKKKTTKNTKKPKKKPAKKTTAKPKKKSSKKTTEPKKKPVKKTTKNSEKATPEQIARLEQLEKQIAKFESQK